ncbi:hypothetical protein SVAN01_06411 [Stagonosporopsis vannaccii]|nr:hypothetical protein SVAN01_06411 [Stagonosporopsis vannaccii]
MATHCAGDVYLQKGRWYDIAGAATLGPGVLLASPSFHERDTGTVAGKRCVEMTRSDWWAAEANNNPDDSLRDSGRLRPRGRGSSCVEGAEGQAGQGRPSWTAWKVIHPQPLQEDRITGLVHVLAVRRQKRTSANNCTQCKQTTRRARVQGGCKLQGLQLAQFGVLAVAGATSS